MRHIDLNIQGSRVSVGPGDPCVVGEGCSTHLMLRFGPEWQGLAKTVQFWDAHGQNPVTCLIGEDMAEQEEGGTVYPLPIPAEPLAVAGTCTLVLEGAKEGVRMRTLPVELEVADAPWAAEAEPPTDPTPTLAQQLQLEVDGLRQYVDESVPVCGVDYWTAEDVAQIVADTKAQIADGEQYRLVETVVTTEPVDEIRRTQEPDGTAYCFKQLLANIYAPIGAEGFSAYVYGNGGEAMSYIPDVVNSTAVRYSRVVLDVSRGLVEGYAKGGTGRHGQSDMIAMPYSYIRAAGKLTMLRFTGGSFPTGTKIDIYGVKA